MRWLALGNEVTTVVEGCSGAVTGDDGCAICGRLQARDADLSRAGHLGAPADPERGGVGSAPHIPREHDVVGARASGAGARGAAAPGAGQAAVGVYDRPQVGAAGPGGRCSRQVGRGGVPAGRAGGRGGAGPDDGEGDSDHCAGTAGMGLRGLPGKARRIKVRSPALLPGRRTGEAPAGGRIIGRAGCNPVAAAARGARR